MDLEKENKRLDTLVKNLLHRIEDNQMIQSHFQAFEHAIFFCDEIQELLDKLLIEAKQHFRLDAVSLLLNDEDHQMRTLTESLGITHYAHSLQFSHNNLLFERLFVSGASARLGFLEPDDAVLVFGESGCVNSSALLPLVRHGEVIGSFNLGSSDPERFSKDKSADFLTHLALTIGVCLENCFSREFLRRQSRIDVLTQIYNRRSFEDELEKELARAERHDHSLALCFVDIDHFKKINDSFGHHSGDVCLKEVAKVMQGFLRKGDILARYGGEEFVVLLPEENIQGAVEVAERMRLGVAATEIVSESGQAFNPTLSIGVAAMQKVAGNQQQVGASLLKFADHAMYEAKRSGRNQVCAAS